eukprot:609560-Rhodomonas_salina.3
MGNRVRTVLRSSQSRFHRGRNSYVMAVTSQCCFEKKDSEVWHQISARTMMCLLAVLLDFRADPKSGRFLTCGDHIESGLFASDVHGLGIPQQN